MVNVLIVYAHAEDTSLNASIKDLTVRSLRDSGHTVVVSDLYKQGFIPVISRQDIVGGPLHPENFRYGSEAKLAMDEGRLSDDIQEEQKKVKAADIIIFQTPLYWLGLPAILKGWFDRVFVMGFAFELTEMFDQARFKGKKAMLSLTTGGSRGWYTNSGPMGDIEVALWPIQNGILRFVGFDVLSPHIIFGVDDATKDDLSVSIKKWETRLRTLTEEPPLDFLPFSAFEPLNPDKPMAACRIKEEAANRNSSTVGPTIGQHLGRPLPVGTMYRPTLHNDDNKLAHDYTGSSAL